MVRWGLLVDIGIPGGIIRRQRPQSPPVFRSPPGSPPNRYRGPGARDRDGYRDPPQAPGLSQDEEDEARLQAAINASLRNQGPSRRNSGGRGPAQAEIDAAFARGYARERAARGQGRDQGRAQRQAEVDAAFARGYRDQRGSQGQGRDQRQAERSRAEQRQAELDAAFAHGYRGQRRNDGYARGGDPVDEDEQLRRALEASRLDAGQNRPRTPPRPRGPRDPYEEETRALVEQLARENGGVNEADYDGRDEVDYEAENERLICQLMEEDLARDQGR